MGSRTRVRAVRASAETLPGQLSLITEKLDSAQGCLDYMIWKGGTAGDNVREARRLLREILCAVEVER
jgi:hypothetical protein